MTHDLDRRLFLKACARTAIATAALGVAGRPGPVFADILDNPPRSRLVDADGTPIRASTLEDNQTLIFNYPYKATPALLIRLDRDPAAGAKTRDTEGHEYVWPGGVGPGNRIVAYAGICPHALSYIAHDTAFLHYATGPTSFSDHDHVIVCCAHGSVYDPAEGARVVAGPAPAPLAAITLEHNPETDELFATGAVGTELFVRFYKAYKRELRKEYGRKAYRKLAESDVVALPPEAYSEDVLDC